MGRENRYPELDDFAVRLIRRKARQLAGRVGFLQADRQDLEQEMAVDLLLRLPHYDPGLAKRETFITRLIDHRVATLIEAQKAGVRDFRKRAGSLDERPPGEDGGPVDEPPLLRERDYVRRVIAGARREEERRDLSADIERVLSTLPAGGPVDLRVLCERLQSASVSEISREIGVPRSALYDAIHKLRVLFGRAGLAVYLERSDRRRAVPVSKDGKNASLSTETGDHGGEGEANGS
jgi:RNA polymerase sigma-70 factor (ECF subfamily)